MPLMSKNFDDLKEADLLSLIESDVSESARLDFKRDNYGTNDESKREFLKDITAIANTYGGMLIIGIDEKEGAACAIKPIKNIDADQEILRLESIANTGCEPTINGLEMKTIPISEGGVVIIVKVPKSWNPPHRAGHKASKRFYKRNSAGCYEMDVNELRKVFTQGMELNDRLNTYRFDRLDKIMSEQTPITMAVERGMLVLHIIPISLFESQQEIAIHEISDREQKLSPASSSSWEGKYNLDGVVTYRPNGHAYTQLNRNGIVEFVSKGICREIKRDNQALQIIPGTTVVEYIIIGICRYLSFLEGIDIAPPFRVYVSLLDVKKCRFATYHDPWGHEGLLPFDRDRVLLSPIDIFEYGNDKSYLNTLKPLFDALWNADGRSHCDYYNEQGAWIGHKDLRL